jgi:lysozyme family protein
MLSRIKTLKAVMARFDKYTPILKEIEGGFSNHPDDMGKETMCGITLKTFRAFFGADKTVRDLQNITEAQWNKIIRTYWDECKADQIKNQSLANLVVDWNVNSGVSGRKGVQKCLGLVADGIFGPKTLAALNCANTVLPFYYIKVARMQFYKELADKKENQINNLGGWLNRLNKFAYDKRQ